MTSPEMTHNPPEKAQEPQNATGTVNPTVEPGLDLVAIEKRLSILGDSTWEDFRGYADGSVSISPDDGESIDVRRWKGCGPFGSALLHANKDIAALVAEVKRLRSKYEGPFVPIEKAREGDVLGYTQVVYAGKGKAPHYPLSPEELADLEAEEEDGYTCACCGEWQPDGVGHRCGEGKE